MGRIINSSSFTTVARMARELEWRKTQQAASILCLHVDRHHLQLARGWHPMHSPTAQPLLDLPYETNTCLATTLTETLHDSNNDESVVLGLIVGWPLQKEGWCGAACGRVLHVLDQLPSLDYNMALYTPTTRKISQEEDMWGRHPAYAHTNHHHEQQQQSAPVMTSATDLWQGIQNAHWPQYGSSRRPTKPMPRRRQEEEEQGYLWTSPLPSRPHKSLVRA